MKKIISLILSVLFMMSVSVTGFAAEREATPDSAEIETQIKKDASEHLYNGKVSVDDIMVTVFGTLSDGSMLVNVCRYEDRISATFTYILDNYKYVSNAGYEVYLYKNNSFCFIVDAYYDGLINAGMLEEISKLRDEFMKNFPDSNCFQLYPIEDSEREIMEDANEQFYNGNEALEYINITFYGTLSDGRLIVNVDSGGGHPDGMFSYDIGKYRYQGSKGSEAYIYDNGLFEFIVDAYKNGNLSDDALAELAVCSDEYLKKPFNYKYFIFTPIETPDVTEAQPTEAETQVTSVQLTESTTQMLPTSQPANVDSSESTTVDVANTTRLGASSDTVINNNSNGAVQTGQNSVILFVFVMTVISAALVFALIKRRYYK